MLSGVVLCTAIGAVEEPPVYSTAQHDEPASKTERSAGQPSLAPWEEVTDSTDLLPCPADIPRIALVSPDRKRCIRSEGWKCGAAWGSVQPHGPLLTTLSVPTLDWLEGQRMRSY